MIFKRLIWYHPFIITKSKNWPTAKLPERCLTSWQHVLCFVERWSPCVSPFVNVTLILTLRHATSSNSVCSSLIWPRLVHQYFYLLTPDQGEDQWRLSSSPAAWEWAQSLPPLLKEPGSRGGVKTIWPLLVAPPPEPVWLGGSREDGDLGVGPLLWGHLRSVTSLHVCGHSLFYRLFANFNLMTHMWLMQKIKCR